jgi:hypothetical protein
MAKKQKRERIWEGITVTQARDVEDLYQVVTIEVLICK